MRFKGKFSGIRKVTGQMNKTEELYSKMLEFMKAAGEIEEYYYEALKVKLDDGSWYCPDFMVIYPNYIGFHEVKGNYKLDGVGHSKFKQAMNKYPFCRWVMVSWQNKREGWKTLHDNGEER